MSDKLREDFENAAREIYEHVNFARGDDYIFDGEKRAYKLWQAATERAARICDWYDAEDTCQAAKEIRGE